MHLLETPDAALAHSRVVRFDLAERERHDVCSRVADTKRKRMSSATIHPALEAHIKLLAV